MATAGRLLVERNRRIGVQTAGYVRPQYSSQTKMLSQAAESLFHQRRALGWRDRPCLADDRLTQRMAQLPHGLFEMTGVQSALNRSRAAIQMRRQT